MMFTAAARARRRSLCGQVEDALVVRVRVHVVMKPCSMPNASSSTLAIGATQFVVHEAFEITWWFAGS